MIKEDLIPLKEELDAIVLNHCERAWNTNLAGMRRKIMGDTGEIITQKCLEYSLNYVGLNNSQVYRGGEKKIMCKIDDDAYFEAQVDKHVEVDGKLKIICEAKTYMDKPYLERASQDFSIIRKYNGKEDKIYSYVISLQDAVKKQTLNFFMKDGHIDYVFFLMKGKRSPIKPIWDPKFRKEIDLDSLYKCISTITNNLLNE